MKFISNTCARYNYKYNTTTSTIRLTTVKSFYQVEELGEVVSVDGAGESNRDTGEFERTFIAFC